MTTRRSTSPDGPLRAAIYARLSANHDPVSLESQAAGGQRYAEARGWPVVGEYIEPKKSGLKLKLKLKERPEGRKLLDAIEAGRVDVIVVRHTDRLSCLTVDVLTVREGCHIAAYDQGIDTTTGARLALGVSAVIGEEESQVKRDRQRAFRAREAAAGRARIGGPRKYGFEKDNLTVREDERAIIKESAREFAKHGSLRVLQKKWWDADIRNAKGNMVNTTSIRNVLLAGEGIPTDIARRCRAILEDPSRRTNRQGANRKHFTLNGLLWCECDHRMYGTFWGKGSGKVPYYRCNYTNGGCGKVSIQATNLDAEVWRQVEIERAFVTGEGFAEIGTEEDAGLRDHIAELEARADNKRADYADDVIDGKTLKLALVKITVDIAELRRQRAELARQAALQESVHDWMERVSAGPESFDETRLIITAAIERVAVRKTDGGKRVAPFERISITWAEGRGFPQVVEFMTADGDKVMMDPAALVRAKATEARRATA